MTTASIPSRLDATRRAHPTRTLVVACVACAAVLFATNVGSAVETDPPRKTSDAVRFGSFKTLFAADSPWNSRPIEPVLGADAIPKAQYVAAISEGAWSTGVFLARDSDPPVTVHGAPGKQGVWDPDTEQMRDVTIPHWPDDLVAASEADGHAEIVDPSMNVVHSFWQLKKIDGQWTASLYAWSRLDGRGWGDPAHYYQGARATGVPSSGGLIRTHEVDDGDTMYRHALGASMTFNGLSANPAYVFPATAADYNAEKDNSGRVAEGALVMLPPDFDVHALTTPELRKIAETLKVYGAYVVDRNVGVPFVVNAEMNSGLRVHKNGWNYNAGVELDAIRAALRPVVATKGWLDGNGRPYEQNRNLNLLSMRGPWIGESGQPAAPFETWKQAIVFPATTTRAKQSNTSGHGLHPVAWAMPQAGQRYRVTAATTGGATLRVFFRNASGGTSFDSGELANEMTKTFVWPGGSTLVVEAASGIGGASTVGGEIVKADP